MRVYRGRHSAFACEERRSRIFTLHKILVLLVSADHPAASWDAVCCAGQMAAEASSQSLVRELLEVGGSPSVKNAANQTPLDLAPKGSSARALLVRAVRKSQSLSSKQVRTLAAGMLIRPQSGTRCAACSGSCVSTVEDLHLQHWPSQKQGLGFVELSRGRVPGMRAACLLWRRTRDG